MSAKHKSIYLLGHYAKRPRQGTKTHVKGWMDDNTNLQYDESVEITRGVKKGSEFAAIILNLSTKTVERNRFNGDTDFKGLFKYFFGGYHQYMTAVMKQLDPEYMDAMVSEMEAEMEAANAAKAIEEAAVIDTVDATEPAST